MNLQQPPTSVEYAKVFVGSPGTDVPTSVNPVGDYTTQLVFQSLVKQTVPGMVDMVNSRLNILPGFKRCRVSYTLAWDVNAVGWRGCRIKNSLGNNFGNVRVVSVGAGASTNNAFSTPWIEIVSGAGSPPDTIQVGTYLDLWPAHIAGVNLICGADLPSSFVQIEFARQ